MLFGMLLTHILRVSGTYLTFLFLFWGKVINNVREWQWSMVWCRTILSQNYNLFEGKHPGVDNYRDALINQVHGYVGASLLTLSKLLDSLKLCIVTVTFLPFLFEVLLERD